jgi:hypothetical protein
MKKVIPWRRKTYAQRARTVQRGLVFLVLLAALTAFVIYRDYKERPGLLETSSLVSVERGTDHIVLEWDEVRNTEVYALYYKQHGSKYKDWVRREFDANDISIIEETVKDGVDKARIRADVTGLDEGTSYVFVIRPENEERHGFVTDGRIFTTRMTQKIKAKHRYFKLTCNKPFNLKTKAKTELTYESENPDVAKVGKTSGKVTLTGPGETVIRVTAAENTRYIGDTTKIRIKVVETTPVSSGGASAHIIYYADSSNCKVVKVVTGSGSATVPQSFGYTGDKYIIAYGMSDSQRIVTYDVDGDGKDVSVPSVALGHPNGFCYSDSTGLCYCVKGWSGRCVVYSPETGGYNVITLPAGCSGIAYDRVRNQFYTSSRTAMRAYSGDGKFRSLRSTGVVKHIGTTYTQDCGGHAGIMMRCLSGSSKHGTNYVDLYDMLNGTYLGSIACELSEVESAVCDKDGYMLLLCNYSGSEDYIWKTDINIEDIGEGL